MEAPHRAAWSYSPVPIPSLPPAPDTMLLGAATLGGEIGVPRHPQVLAATPGACPVLSLLPFPEPVQRGAALGARLGTARTCRGHGPGAHGFARAPGHTALPVPLHNGQLETVFIFFCRFCSHSKKCLSWNSLWELGKDSGCLCLFVYL